MYKYEKDELKFIKDANYFIKILYEVRSIFILKKLEKIVELDKISLNDIYRFIGTPRNRKCSEMILFEGFSNTMY